MLWSLEIAETHQGRSHSAIYNVCSADLTVPVLHGAIIEGTATLVCRLGSRLIAKKEPQYATALDQRRLPQPCAGHLAQVWLPRPHAHGALCRLLDRLVARLAGFGLRLASRGGGLGRKTESRINKNQITYCIGRTLAFKQIAFKFVCRPSRLVDFLIPPCHCGVAIILNTEITRSRSKLIHIQFLPCPSTSCC